MIFVDSSVWIDYFNGQLTKVTDFLDNALGQENLIIGDIILAEVLQGFRHDKNFKTAKGLLTSFDLHQVVNPDIAIKSTDNFRFLRKKGITVRKTVDVLIATYCIENQIMLLQSDKDFHPFAEHLGLRTLPASI